MPVRAVFLVGFMGSGKNRVGQALARRLGWDFVDLDARIEARERQSISEIFRLRGESAFRSAETSVLRDLLANALHRDSVIALGGGAFVQETNRALLRDWPTVFLEAPADELWRRCQQDGRERPLRKNAAQFASLYGERLPFYRQASLVVETTGKTIASICEEIQQRLALRVGQDDTLALDSSHGPAKKPPKNRATKKS